MELKIKLFPAWYMYIPVCEGDGSDVDQRTACLARQLYAAAASVQLYVCTVCNSRYTITMPLWSCSFNILQENFSYPFTFPNKFTSVDTSRHCRVPALDYSVETVRGAARVGFIYTTPSSSCGGRVVGYSFCYQNTSNTVGDNVVIATALVLEDRGENYHIVQNFEVEAQPREDNCLPESRSDLMQCCVSRTLDDPFEVDLQLYGLVIPELPNGPHMIQTQGSTGRGYQFNSVLYTEPQNSILMKVSLGIPSNSSPFRLQMKIFQFVIGTFMNQIL